MSVAKKLGKVNSLTPRPQRNTTIHFKAPDGKSDLLNLDAPAPFLSHVDNVRLKVATLFAERDGSVVTPSRPAIIAWAMEHLSKMADEGCLPAWELPSARRISKG